MRDRLTKRYRLALFGSVYMVQGIAFAFLRNYHKPYLSARGISADVIATLTFFLFLPFLLKFFVGILSDRLSLFGQGHRKPYMVLGLVLASVSLCAAAFVPPDRHLFLFELFTMLTSLGITFLDAVTDGLAIELTTIHERALLQGVMVGGKGTAFVLFSLLFGVLISWRDGIAVFVIMGISMLFPLIWIQRLPAFPSNREQFSWAAFKGIMAPHRAVFALYAVVSAFGAFGTEGIATYYLRVRFGGSNIAIGHYGALRGIGAVVGALMGAWLINRFGRTRIAYAAAALTSLVAVIFGLARDGGDVLLIAFFWGAVWAFGEMVFVVLAMDITDPRIAAATFAAMATLVNLSGAVAESLSVALSDDIGFQTLFWGLSAINLLTIPVLYRLFRAMPDSIFRR